ncbi:MAG: divalent-cation tolerance protein CutA [Alphaproteobacteria bacterium]|jgi:periplasmic divalent cation tolerance protein|nr:divalent-cation tolerance protein CutA [Alphaproteobacteria bacterium]|tara:strand:- start:63 stop:380 length:318 start_codon:yes stop_codon:yes gene_type:complete
MEELTLLYVTCANADEAKAIARVLVGDRLVACANILGSMTSVYRWEGEVAEQEEVAMLLKTRRDMTVHVAERVKSLHSYDLPCVIGLPIQGGNPDFLAWLHREVD